MESETAPRIEIITLETFAERMLVGETTVWKWIKSGRLKPGRHFIQIDRVIRFNWGPELIQRMHEDCSVEETTQEIITEEKRPKEGRRKNNGDCPLNLTY